MSIVLVTSTSTDIGRTIGTAALTATLREEDKEVHVIRPIQTGLSGPDSGDLNTVAELTGIDNLHGFKRYPEPMASVATAQRADMRLPSAMEIAKKIKLIDRSNHVVLMEGAGDLLVGLGEDWALPELAGLLPGSQMVVVTRLGLGCLNEAGLIVEVVRGRRANVTVLVGGSLPAGVDLIIETNLEELPRVTRVPLLGSVQAGAGALGRREFVAKASQWLPDVREWAAGLQIEAARGIVKLVLCEKHAEVARRQNARLSL